MRPKKEKEKRKEKKKQWWSNFIVQSILQFSPIPIPPLKTMGPTWRSPYRFHYEKSFWLSNRTRALHESNRTCSLMPSRSCKIKAKRFPLADKTQLQSHFAWKVSPTKNKKYDLIFFFLNKIIKRNFFITTEIEASLDGFVITLRYKKGREDELWNRCLSQRLCFTRVHIIRNVL